MKTKSKIVLAIAFLFILVSVWGRAQRLENKLKHASHPPVQNEPIHN